MAMFNKPGGPANETVAPAAIEFPETTEYTVIERSGKKVTWNVHLCQCDAGVLMLMRYLLISERQPMPYVVKFYAPGMWVAVEGDQNYVGWKPESPLAI